jgi:MFS family permease
LSIASLALLSGGAMALAASTNLWGLLGALILLSAGNGLFETAMNGAALDWERATGRGALNYMHAGFSAGAVFGALGAGVLLGWGWSARSVLLILAALSCLATFATLPLRYPPMDADAAAMERPGATIGLLLNRRGLLALALICMLGAVGESVANLWSVIYLHAQGAGVLLGGATFALLSGAMLLGLAVAGVVPTVLTAAARRAPGQSGAIAGGMLTAVYLSFMIAPPLIGWLAELFSLQAALLVVGVSGLGMLGLAWGVDEQP